jgi:hypothetical protein
MSELNKVNENDDIILKYRKRILRNKDLIDIMIDFSVLKIISINFIIYIDHYKKLLDLKSRIKRFL